MRTVVYAGTRAVYHDMETACKSLLYHNGADVVFFLIEDDAFPTELPPCVQCINVSDQQYFGPDNPNCMKRWTYMSMMRCALPFLFSGRVLWLDIDTLVLDDLSGLWELPNAPVYMVQETKTDNYFNSGVLLMDCDKMRKDAEKVIKLLNEKEFDYPDQDALNEVMKGRITAMPPEYNVSDWTVKGKNGAKILHFAAVRKRMHRDLRWRQFERMENWCGSCSSTESDALGSVARTTKGGCMITCFKCGKILPGTLCPGEYVMCKECEEKWSSTNLTIDKDVLEGIGKRTNEATRIRDGMTTVLSARLDGCWRSMNDESMERD